MLRPAVASEALAAEAIRSLYARMPKAELHLHLDGSLRPQTALELAGERDGGRWRLAAIERRLRAPPRCTDQAELLQAFELPVRLLQDRVALRRAARELVEDVAAEGTRYVEIRWAPALHVADGLHLRDIVEAVDAGAREGSAATGCVVRLICVAMRSHAPETNTDVARVAAAARATASVTGFDLAGPEAAFPDPVAHLAALNTARAAGLGVTVHAGEWGGPEQVRRALEVAPDRIAHGAVAAADPVLVAELAARAVTLDVCPTSNVQAGIFTPYEAHPLPRLARAGALVTLSTDDRTVSDLTLTEEYRRANELLGLAPRELWRMNLHALEAAFLQDDEPLRQRLLDEFQSFAATEPLLA